MHVNTCDTLYHFYYANAGAASWVVVHALVSCYSTPDLARHVVIILDVLHCDCIVVWIDCCQQWTNLSRVDKPRRGGKAKPWLARHDSTQCNITYIAD